MTEQCVSESVVRISRSKLFFKLYRHSVEYMDDLALERAPFGIDIHDVNRILLAIYFLSQKRATDGVIDPIFFDAIFHPTS